MSLYPPDANPVYKFPENGDESIQPDGNRFLIYNIDFSDPKINSIPDRIKRGYCLVAHLFDKNIIREQTRIMIIGTGATGIAAACAAKDKNVTAFVADFLPLFSLQRGCTTRFLHPRQYSWPDPKCEEAVWKWTPPIPPILQDAAYAILPWEAGPGNLIASHWTHWFDEVQAHSTPTVVQDNVAELTAIGAPAANGKRHGLEDLKRLFKQENCPFPDIEVVIVAKSHKEEKVRLEDAPRQRDFQGFRFWEDDPYEEPGYGLPTGTVPKAFISGGGNGGLQDYLRIVTQAQPIEILKSLQDAYANDQAAERTFLETFCKQNHEEVDWHKCEQAAQEALDAISKDHDAESKMRALVKFPFHAGATLKFVSKDSDYRNSYPLNVWPVLILSKFIKIISGEDTLLFNFTTKDIDPGQNSDGDGPWKYHGTTNRVFIKSTVQEGEEQEFEANIIVLRNGVYPFVASKDGAAAPNED
jgi:hypothetical protein